MTEGETILIDHEKVPGEASPLTSWAKTETMAMESRDDLAEVLWRLCQKLDALRQHGRQRLDPNHKAQAFDTLYYLLGEWDKLMQGGESMLIEGGKHIELGPKEEITGGEGDCKGHCWHNPIKTDLAIFFHPGDFAEVCCWCGAKRRLIFPLPKPHGVYRPAEPI